MAIDQNWGLTDKGLVIPRMADLIETIVQDYEAQTGLDVQRDPDDVVYLLCSIMGARLGEAWETLQALYDARDPSTATGFALDSVAALVGLTRLPATASEVDLTLTGDVDTTVPKASVVEDVDKHRWKTTEDATITDPVCDIVISTYDGAADYTVTIDGADYTQAATTDAPTTLAALMAAINAAIEPDPASLLDSDHDGTVDTLRLASDDGTSYSVTVSATGSGAIKATQAGTATVLAVASETGPIEANADAITKIVTPVAGWTSVTNELAASSGRDEEKDPELRLRRQNSLAIRGGGSLKAIRAALLQFDYVQQAVVLENGSSYTQDIAGVPDVPPHSLVPVILTTKSSPLTGDKIKEVAAVLYDSVVAGVECYGLDEQVSVTGSDGAAKICSWTYAQELQVDVEVRVDGVTPADVEQEITALVDDYFEARAVGEAIRRLGLLALIATVDSVEAADILLNGVADDVVPNQIEVAARRDITIVAL